MVPLQHAPHGSFVSVPFVIFSVWVFVTCQGEKHTSHLASSHFSNLLHLDERNRPNARSTHASPQCWDPPRAACPCGTERPPSVAFHSVCNNVWISQQDLCVTHYVVKSWSLLSASPQLSLASPQLCNSFPTMPLWALAEPTPASSVCHVTSTHYGSNLMLPLPCFHWDGYIFPLHDVPVDFNL